MAKQPRDRQQWQPPTPVRISMYEILLTEIRANARGYRGWAMPAYQEAHDAGQCEMAAWLACGAAGKSVVLQEFTDSKHFTKLVDELEKCFGEIPANSCWPSETRASWAHLVAVEMTKFELGWSGDPAPAPALTM